MENQTSAKLATAKARILAEIAALQTDGNGVFDAPSWADFGALGSRLTKAGVDWKSCELGSNFTAFMEAAFRDEAERGEIVFRLNKAGAHPNSRVRLTKAPKKAVAASSVPEKKSTLAVKTAIPASPSASPSVSANAPKKLSDAEVEKRVLAAVAALQTDENGVRDAAKWVDFANLGSPLKKKGVDGKAFGFSTFAKFLQARFAERLEFRNEGTRWRVRPKTANAPSTLDATQAPSSEPPKKFLPDAEVEKRVFAAIRELQTNENGVRDASAWVPYTRLGARLKEKGVDGKTAGFSSFAKFFETRFADQLEFDGDPNAR